MSRLKLSIIILVCVLLIGGSIALWAAVSNDDDDDEIVPLSEVPTMVKDAANEAVPGGEITEVEKETVYEVEKVVEGVEYDIEVTVVNGKVAEVEIENDDNDKADDD